MSNITNALLDLKQLELLADGNTAIHRLHPLARTLVTFLFITMVVSFNRYELIALFPFFLFPIVMTTRSNLPCLFILKKVALFLPFVLLVGIFNPLFDRTPLLQFGSLTVSGGWISLFSIIIRSTLTVAAAMILIGTTGFSATCQALRNIGVPQIFTTQLLLLYRYLCVLAEEAGRASLARELRSCGTKGQGISSYASLIGGLLLRTWGRAERIHGAMLARGFNGEFPQGSNAGFGRADIGYCLVWSALFILFRLQNIPLLLGNLVTGLFA